MPLTRRRPCDQPPTSPDRRYRSPRWPPPAGGRRTTPACGRASDAGHRGRTPTCANGAAAPNGPTSTRSVPTVDAIRAELPAADPGRGKLDDRRRRAARRVPAAGLRRHRPEDPHRLRARPRPAWSPACSASRPQLNNATWENLFVGIDSGRTDVGFSNITDTEQRKQKYDFATYRQDNLAFETLARPRNWNFTGDYEDLAGQDRRRRRGHQPGEDPPGVAATSCRPRARTSPSSTSRTATPSTSPWQSGKIDIYLGPNPGVAYQVAQARTRPTRAQRGHLLRRGRDAAGPDRRHDEEGQRPGQAGRRRHQLPHPERPVPTVAHRVEPRQRGREDLGGQPARTAHHQHVIDAHAVRRIRRITRAPNRSAVSGTRSSTAWNWPKASNPSGTRSGVNP